MNYWISTKYSLLFEEVPEVLKSLKEKNFKLAILSNGTPSLLNELVQSNKLDNLFDDIFLSKKLVFLSLTLKFMICQ